MKKLNKDLLNPTELNLLQSDIKRFWDKVEVLSSDECWEWQASIRNSGYGRMWLDGHNPSAHRISWTIHHGPIPPNLNVLHKCNNKLCVNPDHLYLGTQGDNNMDMYRRSNLPKAGRVSMFSKDDLDDIKKLRSSGMTHQKIADIYRCSRTHILHIVNGNKLFLGVNLRP